MRRILLGLVLLTAVCVVPPAVEAREVVEFTDGRYLEIRSYVVSGDLIRLDVERGSFIVIPVASVEEIRRDRDVVFSSILVVAPGPHGARSAPYPARPARAGTAEESPPVARFASAGS